ncbi:Bacterial membrane flanked domain protein [Rosistilla oblonga]|uniref:PH domain-containing protein n=1 Tax=Rosistilla oblonga TaxID=2527990 RepID=UPI00118CA5C3|nr:PH domain-containing protein [Rosistilla oblonga]QDV12039.1 Bacterial membrane flanked domain protein [Rosistilla oblonga]
MAKEWFIRQGGKSFGPYRSDKLKLLASEGRIESTAQVANDKSGPWHPVTRLTSLKLKNQAATNVMPELPPQIPEPAPPFVPEAITSNATQNISRGEEELWKGRPSQITNIKSYIMCALFCWLIVPIFVAIWRYLVVNSIRYELTNQRFRVSWGVLSRHMNELELYRVKDIGFSQTFFQRLTGLATISITSSDSSTPYTSIESIPATRAKMVRERLRTVVEELRDRKRVREVDYASH